MDLPAWFFWLALAIVLALTELLGAAFVLFALAICALVMAMLLLVFDLSMVAQLIIFSGFAAVAAPVAFTQYRRHRQYGRHRHVALTGERGAYMEEIYLVEEGPAGPFVRVKGDRFPVRGVKGESIEPGEYVRLDHFKGITAQVYRASKEA